MQSYTEEANLPKDFYLNVDDQWRKLRLKDEEEEDKTSPSFQNKAFRMMQMMGYKSGSGLGKNSQGIIKAIEVSQQLGKRGLGCVESQETWDFSQELVEVVEKIEWLNSNSNEFEFTANEMNEWLVKSERITNISKQNSFCDERIKNDAIQGKNIFDQYDLKELCQARAKANPFETIRSVFFMNRAALKMANIDAATDFMFTKIELNQNGHPRYFADICAGPGGFSEYLLWRKNWHFKGFGLTLKDENDFKLSESICASPVTFQPFYGSQGDGNVCNPKNIADFRTKVRHETCGEGVDFVTSDGGFSVEGNENLQEVLSKNIYLCQCLVALEILTIHGHFVTKMFDLFTHFSVGLIFLMYQCFEQVCIMKPNSSRPANSERYFICKHLKDGAVVDKVRLYLRKIALILWEIKDDPLDLIEIVPLIIIKNDETFFRYIYASNNRLAERQAVNLRKLAMFCRNPSLKDPRQDDLRTKCLTFWQIPDRAKLPLPKLTIDDLLTQYSVKSDLLLIQPREIHQTSHMIDSIIDLNDWHYAPMQSSTSCNFYIAIGTCQVFRWQHNQWIRVKNLHLVRGTFLYGELVKEKCVSNGVITFKHSLHVIDALRLGDLDLFHLKFNKRKEFIDVYCKSVNHEFRGNVMRVRAKIVETLHSLTRFHETIWTLPVLGLNTEQEYYDVNSILLLKTNEHQSFHSTYVLRGQIYFRSDLYPDGISISEIKKILLPKFH